MNTTNPAETGNDKNRIAGIATGVAMTGGERRVEMQEDYDSPYFGDDWLMSTHSTPVLHVQGVCRPPEVRARLFMRMRLHMVMKPRACSFAEAYRIVREKDASRGEDENG